MSCTRANARRMTPTRRDFLKHIGIASAGAGLLSLTPGCTTSRSPALPILPRSTPEAEGVSSAGILAFLDAIAASTHELHSFMMLRHGRVIAEGWWKPYGPDYVHTMYSMSKSFTSTAVGIAVSEGRLTVNDPVTSFFPGELPVKVSDNLARLKVKHLLTMSVGNEREPTGAVVKEENWVKTFLAQPISHEPGTVFMYNSAATYMCSAIVQKVTGQRVIDYLRPRLFDPLNVGGMTWETCPRGINTGGWGLSIQTEGLAKFGQLYLQKGEWHGRQLLPATWVDEATSFKIQQPAPAKPSRPNAQNDWLQGYCYQFWRCQNGAYRGDGAFGQYTIVLPDKDAVIVMTGESNNMQGELDLVWQHLLPAIRDTALPVDDSLQAKLQRKLTSLALPVTPRQFVGPWPARMEFSLESNELGLTGGSMNIKDGDATLTLRTQRGEHTVRCGNGRWLTCESAVPGTPPRIISGGTPPAGTPAKIAATCTIPKAGRIEMLWRYYETPHHDSVIFETNGRIVTLTFLSSIAKMRGGKDSRPPLKGTLTAKS